MNACSGDTEQQVRLPSDRGEIPAIGDPPSEPPLRVPTGVQSIADAIALRAAATDRSPALVGLGTAEVSFAQLHACISSFATQLATAGLGREDRVGLLVPAGLPGAQLIVALACNIILVPMNPALTPKEMVELSRVSGLKAIVIPAWLETSPPSALLDQEITALEAISTPDGALSLRLLTAAPACAAPSRPARDTDIALLLRSSGTTGDPKLIPVTHRNLLAMAEKFGSALWFHLSAADRAACLLPLYYAAGLKTSLFVPLILGASVGFPPAGQALDVEKWLDALRPTYLSLSPGLLNGLLDRLRASSHEIDCSSLRFVMCAAAYLPDDVRIAAEAMLRVPVLEFYGLSEAGVMAANPVPPGKGKPGTVGRPAPGELQIVDDHRKPVAQGSIGQIMISGPTVTPGYVVRNDSLAGELKDGWLLTGDLGRIDADGYLTIVGRVKEVINRGGEKVFPYEIEKAMLQHPAVLEAAAFGVPHPRLGENVAAAAVLRPGSTLSERELKEFLAGRLAGFKLPRRLCLVPSLPRNASGKILRRALAEAHSSGRPAVTEAEGLLELEILGIWERLLATDDIGVDDDFFEIGGDSLLATEMLMEVELLAGRPYPQSELSTLTIRRIADVVTSNLADGPERMTQLKSGTGIPLFLFHGDFPSRGLYALKLAALLPHDGPVYLLHSDAQPLVTSSMEEIAGMYLGEVLRVAPHAPVILAGYCNGGLAAWHLAHLLRSRGVDVAELLLIETLAINARPGMRKVPALFQAAASFLPGRAGRFLREDGMRAVWVLYRRGLLDSAKALYRLARIKVLSALRREPPSEDRRAATQRVNHIYYRLMSRYVPPRLDVDVTCFIADEGNHADTDPRYWRALAKSVGTVNVPGTHASAIVSGRQALATALTEALNRATARHAGGSTLPDSKHPDRNVDAGAAPLLVSPVRETSGRSAVH